MSALCVHLYSTFRLVTEAAAGRGGAGLDGFNCSDVDVSTVAVVFAGRNTSFSNVNFTSGVIFLLTRSGSTVTLDCSEFAAGDLSELLLVTCDDMPTGERGAAGCCGGTSVCGSGFVTLLASGLGDGGFGETGLGDGDFGAVSYTHLTLPTILRV